METTLFDHRETHDLEAYRLDPSDDYVTLRKRRAAAAGDGRVTIRKQLAPPTAAERGRIFDQFMALVTAYMAAHPGMSHNTAADVVRSTAQGAALWAQTGMTANARPAEPRPASSALTKRAAAGQRLEVLAAAQGVTVSDLIAAAHRNPAKYADAIAAMRDYSAADGHKTAEQLADDARKGLAVVKQQAARQAAGEPSDFDAAVKTIVKRDNVPYNAAALRAASEYPALYREWQQR